MRGLILRSYHMVDARCSHRLPHLSRLLRPRLPALRRHRPRRPPRHQHHPLRLQRRLNLLIHRDGTLVACFRAVAALGETLHWQRSLEYFGACALAAWALTRVAITAGSHHSFEVLLLSDR